MTAFPALDRSRSRRVGFNVVAVLFGLVAALTGTTGLISAFTAERLLHRIHDVAPSLVFVLVFATGCVALLGGRRRSIAAAQQVSVGVAGMAIGWAAGLWFDPVVAGFLAVLAVLVVLLAVLHPMRPELVAVPRVPRPVITTVAVAVAAPLLWYAVDQAGLQRTLDPANPHVAEGHYAGMASAAFVFALLALLAAVRSDGSLLPAWSAGLGIAVLGALSVATPLLAGSFPAPWGVAAIGGGAALVIAGEADARRPGRGEPAESTGTTDDTLDRVS